MTINQAATPASTRKSYLYALFFLSGVAGLVYEVLWLKELGLLFGNTAYAAATTLAVFFIGLAAGSHYFGRRAEVLARPLRTYALLEFAIAASALLYFLIAPTFGWIYVWLFPVMGGHLAFSTSIKFLLALGILFPPAFFMGGTLPVMGQHLIRRSRDLGRFGTLLYMTNTLGAAVGAFLAGFVLPPLLGFQLSFFAAFALSVLVGLVAWSMDRRLPLGGVAAVVDRSPEPETTDPPEPGARITRRIRTLAFLSGFLVLGLEVLWTRMFAQVLHNSVYSFTAILVTFLIALSVGSGLANVLCRRRSLDPGKVLAAVSLASWILVAVSSWLFVRMTDGLVPVVATGGWDAYVFRIFGLAAAVMLLPGILMGSVYPYLLRASEQLGLAPGRMIGRLAAANSVGGILGSLLAGFLLLAVIGLWGGISLLASGYLAVAVVAWTGARRTPAIAVGLAVVVTGIGFVATTAVLDDLPIIHLDVDRNEQLLEAWEGRHGTVAVVAAGENRLIKVDNHYSLGDLSAFESERRQAQIPLFLVSPPRTVFFLGMGTGITAGGALDFPIERLTTCELIPEVVTASRRHFSRWTNGLFVDERSQIVVEDGRHYLAGTRELYDLIISDLFVPWHAGTGSLYTREHFEICRSRIEDGGHFVLWVPACLLNRQEFDIIARTVLDVFPYVTVWRGEFLPEWPTLGFVCSTGPQSLDPIRARLNIAYVIPDPVPARLTESDVLPYIMYAGNLAEASELFVEASINTDDRPVIEYASPKTQQRADGGKEDWLRGEALLRLLEDLAAAAPIDDDPYLAGLRPDQLQYVRAGQLLYEVGVYVTEDRIAEAAPVYRQYLSLLPFDMFPGLDRQ